MFVGFYLVKLDAELVFHQFAIVEEHAEDTDRTGNGSGIGVDIVGCTTDVIASRCCVSAHGNHYGFLGFQLGDCVPDLF